MSPHARLSGTPNNAAVALQVYRVAEAFVRGRIAAEPRLFLAPAAAGVLVVVAWRRFLHGEFVEAIGDLCD